MAPKKVTNVEKPKRKIVELETELITNGLIQFTLFLMGKFNSKVEQIESRTASWNGLCSTFEGPLYFRKLCNCLHSRCNSLYSLQSIKDIDYEDRG
jgi:hypothetical protein